MSEPLSTLRVLVHSGVAWRLHLLSWLLVSWFLLSRWVLKDGGVHLLVKVLAGLGFGSGEAFFPIWRIVS